MPAALITGITGQDGGFLAERLLAEGVVVHGLVHHDDPALAELAEALPELIIHHADLADSKSLPGIVADIEPDEIYNLGGITSVAQSWDMPALTAQVTGVAAASLLAAAWDVQERIERPVRFLQASSAEIFGSPTVVPQDESTPIAPTSPYGAAKAYAHHMVGIYRERGLHACSCIFYNHESPRRPDTFVTRKITMAAAAIAAGKQETLALGDLEVLRDWGWAPDYVDAMVRALRHDVPDDYVIATGESHSVADFVAAAFQRVGIADWRSRVEIDPAFVRPAEAHELRGDASKARRVLGWSPTVGFDELVGRTVDADVELLAQTQA